MDDLGMIKEYGSLGLLAIMLIGGGKAVSRLLERVADRVIKALDEIAEGLRTLDGRITRHELEDTQRFADIGEKIEESAKETRRVIGGALRRELRERGEVSVETPSLSIVERGKDGG